MSIFVNLSSPNLSAKRDIVVDNSGPQATFRRSARRSNARWSSTDHQHFEMGCVLQAQFPGLSGQPCVVTDIPSSQSVWQVRQC
jgi:hypothetical protein